MGWMDGITWQGPEPFVLPEYDYAPIKAAAQATDMSKYYGNLLDDAFARSEEDIMCKLLVGMSPKVTQRYLEGAKAFDWPSWEDRIKGMGDHYKLKVSGLEDQGSIGVHFIHIKSDNPNAKPMLMVHGWPGSFLEFLSISRSLKKNYHLVIPSIPGFAFSDPPKKASKVEGELPWGYTKNSICFQAIMLSLGYEKYLVQGGDWGSMLVRYVALLFPDSVVAIHLNHFSAVTTIVPTTGQRTALEQEGLDRLALFRHKKMSHMEVQGTEPYTFGAVLACSPIALILWIGSKMHRWSGPNTHPPVDEVIANCMLYWFTGNITSSFWLYYMRRSGSGNENAFLESAPFTQPIAFGCGRYENHWPLRRAFERQMPKIRHWRVLDDGGHFLAEEAPDLLQADIDDLFQSSEVQGLF